MSNLVKKEQEREERKVLDFENKRLAIDRKLQELK